MPSLKQPTKPVTNAKSIHPVEFIRRVTTVTSIRFCSVMLTLGSRVPLESHTLWPMLPAISLNMAVKKNSTNPVDPPNFLWALKCKLSNIREVPFGFNTQDDVAEILQVVLDELKGVSLTASHLISNTIKITVSCNT